MTTDINAATKIFDYLQGLQSTSLMTLITNNSIILLFRLLFTKRNVNEMSLKAAENILIVAQDVDKSITLILKQFLNQHTKFSPSATTILMDTVDPIITLGSNDLITNQKSNEMLDHSEILGEKLGKMLLDNVDVEKTGLIVDWLTSVELEIANTEGGQLQVRLNDFGIYFCIMYAFVDEFVIFKEEVKLQTVTDIYIVTKSNLDDVI